jgi:aspartokinase
MDTKQSLLFVAEQFEEKVQSVTGFDLKQAQLIGIELTTSYDYNILAQANQPTIVSQPLDASGDVYELLDTAMVADALQAYGYAAVITCGWAAPLADDDENTEVAPSKHPKRRRVRLVLVTDGISITSVLRFSDTQDEKMVDEGQATGSLADALLQAAKRKGKQ